MKKRFVEIIIAGFLLVLAVSVSFLPTIYYVAKASATTTFPLIHNNYPDYYFYLSLMHQGFEGNWLVSSRITPEHFPPQFIQTFFVFLGQLGRISSISLPVIYTLSRLILGLGLGLLIYYLITLFNKRAMVRIIGFIFVLFGSSFWLINNKEIQSFMTVWTAFDPRERITFLPHHLFGTISIILSIIFLTQFIRSYKNKFLLTACIMGFIGTFVNPISLLNFFMAVILCIPIYIILNLGNKHDYMKIALPLFIYLSICAYPFFYLFIIQNTTFPWNTYNPGLNMMTLPISFQEYILGLGPAFVFALFGIKELLRRKNFLSSILLAWLISPFIGIFILFRFFKLSNVYFLYAAHYIPVGIIAGVGFANFIEKIASKFKLRRRVVFLPLFVLLVFYFAVSWHSSLKKEMSRWTPNIYNIYLPNDFFSAFQFLNTHTLADSTIISGGLLGNIIPAFTHNRTFVGHIVNTYQFDQKLNEMTIFFSQKDITQAQELIKKYHISYVFFSYDTGPAQPVFVEKLGLKSIYQNPTVTIFQTSI